MLDEIPPWPEVHTHEEVVTQLMDQCMTGAKDDQGLPVHKATEWTSNSATLVKHMQRYMCDRSHIHGNPTGKALNRMKVYSWMLCRIVVYDALAVLPVTVLQRRELRRVPSTTGVTQARQVQGPSAGLPSSS